MALNTGDTRMSVFPQVALPNPAYANPGMPLVAFNQGLDTSTKLAQIAEDYKMQPLKEQMAQIQLKEAQRQLLKPLLQPTTQTLEMQDRQVPSVFDPKLYKEAYDSALAERMSTYADPTVEPSPEDLQYAEHQATASSWVVQPNAQDSYIKKHFTNLETGADVTQTDFSKSADQIATEQALANQRNMPKFVQKTLVGPDGKATVYNVNLDTGEKTPLGEDAEASSRAALRQAQMDRYSQLNDVSKQTAASQQIYRNINGGVVPSPAQIAAWSQAASHEGVSIPMYLRILKSSSPYMVNGYLKQLMTNGPQMAEALFPGIGAEAQKILAQSQADEEAIAQSQAATQTATPGTSQAAPVGAFVMPAPSAGGVTGAIAPPQASLPGAFPKPNRAQVALLLQRPDLKNDFDTRFGPGSADQILNAHP